MPIEVKALALAILGAALASGCARRPVRAPEPVAVQPQVVPAGAQYRIDAAASLLTIRTFRAGTMARLGHNHVIASRHLSGTLWLAPTIAASSVEMRIPVALLTIDEPELRAQAGEAFSAPVPDDARAGTRRNMLGPELLDADRFPGIELRSLAVAATPDGARVRFSIGLRAARHELEVPVKLERSADAIIASGAFGLRQSDLGLRPFSVLLGAIQVADETQIQFRVLARAL
jgi:polyisoprenoid-binding protein YceI